MKYLHLRRKDKKKRYYREELIVCDGKNHYSITPLGVVRLLNQCDKTCTNYVGAIGIGSVLGKFFKNVVTIPEGMVGYFQNDSKVLTLASGSIKPKNCKILRPGISAIGREGDNLISIRNKGGEIEITRLKASFIPPCAVEAPMAAAYAT